ncbi:MAG: heme-binding protein [Caldilineales bacterium]|nr:heme-binding protein [Caldilineales bacterium]MCW5857084.1 heme-binding protein [Caldilineales bacterium]
MTPPPVPNNPQLARYDPPWRLPFFRRNEMLIACR